MNRRNHAHTAVASIDAFSCGSHYRTRQKIPALIGLRRRELGQLAAGGMGWKRKSSGRGGRDEMRERLIPADGGCAAGCVPPGCVAVLVGGGEEPERVVVDVRALAQPCVRALLEAAQREFGFDQKGVLRIPCAADEFRRAVAAGGHRCRR